ncbi:stress protein [Pseudomonas thivervalensis]|uniref:Stress protein n=1 Tax=Pseudomonas thivervalensis TaxID=86265 RepID=A0A2Z4ZAV3_9PSED|nr:stress protein [Pseudomonas thivervalensis]AXA60905.1 stress protein [Pseudomonas thivervalensis]
MPGSSSIYPTNIAHDRTKVSEAGRKSGRTTITTVDRNPSKAEIGRKPGRTSR